jgi:hypothetical protein
MSRGELPGGWSAVENQLKDGTLKSILRSSVRWNHPFESAMDQCREFVDAAAQCLKNPTEGAPPVSVFSFSLFLHFSLLRTAPPSLRLTYGDPLLCL